MPAQRRLEYSESKQRKEDSRTLEADLGDYFRKTAFSNFVRCVLCKCNIMEKSSEVINRVEDIDGMQVDLSLNRNLNLLDRRFEKFARCSNQCTDNFDGNDGGGNGGDTQVNFEIVQDDQKLIYHPVLENHQPVKITDNNLPDNNVDVSLDNDDGNDANPERALDALLQLLESDDDESNVESLAVNRNNADNQDNDTRVVDADNHSQNSNPVSEQGNEPSSEDLDGGGRDDRFITVLYPNSEKVSQMLPNLRNSSDRIQIQKVLYSGQDFDRIRISKMYQVQAKKYYSSSSFYSGAILNYPDRIIRTEQLSNDSKVRGSEKYIMKIGSELEARMEQCGQFCLRVFSEIPLRNLETIATCLLQQNLVVTVSMKGDSSGRLQREYHVHTSHRSNTNCSEPDCQKVDLETYLNGDAQFDDRKLKNQYLPTYVLSCSKKLDEFVNCLVKCPKSSLFAKEYFFQLVYRLDSTICIEGVIWPECFQSFNKLLANNSFNEDIDKEAEKEFLLKVEEAVFCSSDTESISKDFNISSSKAQKIKSDIMKYQVHIPRNENCSNCCNEAVQLPSLAMILTKPLLTPQNSYSVRRFLEVFRTFLSDLGDYGKKTLSTIEWLRFIWEEHVSDERIEENTFSLSIEGEKFIFFIDDYLKELMNKWPELMLLAPYHYCLTFAETRQLIFKTKNLSDCFTHLYSQLFLGVLDTTIILQPIFGFQEFLWKKEVNHESYFLPGHKEISLAEAIALVDAHKTRFLSSRPVEFINTHPNAKMFFKKIGEETDVSYKEGSENYEQHETMISRFFMRLNGTSMVLAELCSWYDYCGLKESSEIFPLYKNKLGHIEDSNETMLNDKEFLPSYILSSNGDVMKKRKTMKILSFPTVTYLSYEYKYSKVILFHNINNLDDLSPEVVDRMFDEPVDASKAFHAVTNPKFVEYQERKLFPLKLKSK